MRSPIWTSEKLKDLPKAQLGQLLANAKKHSDLELVAKCEQELASRPEPKRSKHAASGRSSDLDVVVGYHFVCQRDRGVMIIDDDTFWSGSWVVSEKNVQQSIKYNAYLALHNSKSIQSYRQGIIIEYRKTARSMISKNEDGIEFKVRIESESYDWVGSGTGEKGYKWAQVSRLISGPRS